MLDAQVQFTSTNTFPSKTQGNPLKIKDTLSPSSTMREHLWRFYILQNHLASAHFLSASQFQDWFSLFHRENKMNQAQLPRTGGRGRVGRDCHKYLFAGLGNFCNSLWISKVILGVWMIYIGRTSCHICQLSTQDHLCNNIYDLSILHIHGIVKLYFHWNRLLDQN